MNNLASVKENYFKLSRIFTVVSCFLAFYFYLCSSSEVRFFIKAQEAWFLPEIEVLCTLALVVLGIFVGGKSLSGSIKALTVIWGVVSAFICTLCYFGWESGYSYLGWSFLVLPFILSTRQILAALKKRKNNSNEKFSEWFWSAGTFLVSCQITLCVQAIMVTTHLSIGTAESVAVLAKLNTFLYFPIDTNVHCSYDICMGLYEKPVQ